jgi:hypothetical protein
VGRRGNLAYGLYLAAVTVVLGYGLSTAVRSQRAYVYLKGSHSGFSGKIHRFDPELGYSAIPGARGARTFPIGPSFPVQYDRFGFRIPADMSPDRELRRPLVLALGCSYTFGDACPAEETYPELVARALGGTSLNAGKCAQGLAQMLLLARRLIPEHRPEYVLVQHSPWLVTRGLSGFGRSALAKAPAPYFYRSADGALRIQPPAFRGAVFDLPVVDYDSGQRSLFEAVSFFWRVGLPVFLQDDAAMLGYRWRRWRGTLPAPAADREGVVRDAYREIARLCERQGSGMVVVRLAQALDLPKPLLEGQAARGRVLIAPAQERLNQAVTERSEPGYERRFGHWRGSPPVFVDPHPNPAAHRVIADTVLEAIRTAQTPGGSPQARSSEARGR